MDAAVYALERFPDSSMDTGSRIVIRNGRGRRYAIVSRVPAAKAGAPGSGDINLLTIPVGDYLLLDDLLHEEGFLPALGIGRGAWISVRLDGSVDDDTIRSLIDRAYYSLLPE